MVNRRFSSRSSSIFPNQEYLQDPKILSVLYYILFISVIILTQLTSIMLFCGLILFFYEKRSLFVCYTGLQGAAVSFAITLINFVSKLFVSIYVNLRMHQVMIEGQRDISYQVYKGNLVMQSNYVVYLIISLIFCMYIGVQIMYALKGQAYCPKFLDKKIEKIIYTMKSNTVD